jgi:RHS repeat-associated protein
VFYYFSDHLGSASEVTDQYGNVQDESDYYPFGGEDVITQATDQDYKFTGKQWDTESGLNYFGARFYSSSLGRWLTPDWAEKPTAVPYADYENPQSLNLYGFVVDNPLGRIDTNGHGQIDIKAAATGLMNKISTVVDHAEAFAAAHPQATQIVKGVVEASAGVAGVAASAAAAGGTDGLAAPLAIIGAQSSTALFVKGVADIMGGATNTDVSAGKQALDAVANPGGLATSIVTGGDLQAGATASAITDLAAAGAGASSLSTGTAAESGLNIATTAATTVNATSTLVSQPTKPINPGSASASGGSSDGGGGSQ